MAETNITELAQSLKAAAEKAGIEQWQAKKNGPGEYGVMVKGSLVKRSGWSTHRPVADEVVDKKTADFIAKANPANILTLVEALPQPQQPVTLDTWIPVSERMPEKGQRVLICIDFDSTAVPRLVKDAEYTGSTFRVGPNTVNTEGEPRVTHWRAVPELPTLQNSELPVSKLVNDVNSGKSLTITLPDISSKAFWSGSGKTEVFHPETYKCWVKEAIEQYCAIARIDVEVK